MLRTYADQVSLWEAVLPEEVRGLSVELERVDRLLDDEVFFAPIAGVLSPQRRPAVDTHRDVPAADVLEVQVWPGV